METKGRHAWMEAATYAWTSVLSSSAWAWEFLRRNPDYRTAWAANPPPRRISHAVGITTAHLDSALTYSAVWGVVLPDDPEKNALEANVIWSPDQHRGVLPALASPSKLGTTHYSLPISGYACRITVYDDTARNSQHVLFASHGRAVQLEVAGCSVLDKGHLLIDAGLTRNSASKRRKFKELEDLLKHRALRPTAHLAVRNAQSLARCLQAVDGWLDGAAENEIATALFGKDRFEKSWGRKRGYLLFHARKILERGLNMTRNGYHQLLRSGMLGTIASDVLLV